MDLITISLITVVALLFWVVKRKTDPLNRIPGPFRLPIFGNIQFNFPRMHMQFTEFAQRYGDVFRIQILSQPAIVINSYAALKEAYLQKGKHFIGRPHMLRFEVVRADKGIAFQGYSEKQKHLRTEGIKALRMESLDHLSSTINENLADLTKMIRAQNGQAFNPKVLIKKCLVNVILSMIFGEKVDSDDPILEKIIEFNKVAVEVATIGREDVDVWTWTRHFNPNYALSVKGREVFDKNIMPLYLKYKSTYIEGHERGVIDKYISQVNSGKITDENVCGLLIDYFVGGVETTATTLYGFLLILAHLPKVQERLQSDVDEIIGKDRHPRICDRPMLPYVEACLLELFRYQCTLPILVPRETISDTELCGYEIPKGTWVYTNSWAIHHDENLYPDSMSYKPSRFLDTEGQILPQEHIARKSLVTFGMGGRSCIGENLAKNRLFLSICTLMQNFTFEADKSCPLPSCDARDYKLKIVFDIHDYSIVAKPRC
ncbi:steroid 17-alpha-hydroxylase/17,20 lyase-like [Watersipora subatra]|uniref:steroid 17-alpha-hydroxylase/17,20 lyase-like n=1 Tax=Watersipora subatra TaxID=2589382 RepID=UPI00355B2E29